MSLHEEDRRRLRPLLVLLAVVVMTGLAALFAGSQELITAHTMDLVLASIIIVGGGAGGVTIGRNQSRAGQGRRVVK